MEKELSTLALQAEKILARIETAAPEVVAGQVYARRKHGLIRSVSLTPVLIGCLMLSSTFVISLSAPSNTIRDDFIIERVSPGNAETIWKRKLTPRVGAAYSLTLDLRNRLTAQEIRSQRVLWQHSLPPVAASSAPIVIAEKKQPFVAVATAVGKVYYIAASSGEIVWQQNLSDTIEVSPLPVKEQILTVACADGRIYGLSRIDGHIQYMLQTGSRISALEPVADGSGENIYAVADGRRVLALNASSGDLRWRRDTFGTVTDSPIVAAGTIIAPTTEGNDSKLWAFDETGNIRWINTFDRYTNLAATKDYLAIAQGSIVTLIRASTGEPVHYWQLPEAPADLKLVRESNRVVVRTDQGMLVSMLN